MKELCLTGKIRIPHDHQAECLKWMIRGSIPDQVIKMMSDDMKTREYIYIITIPSENIFIGYYNSKGIIILENIKKGKWVLYRLDEDSKIIYRYKGLRYSINVNEMTCYNDEDGIKETVIMHKILSIKLDLQKVIRDYNNKCNECKKNELDDMKIGGK